MPGSTTTTPAGPKKSRTERLKEKVKRKPRKGATPATGTASTTAPSPAPDPGQAGGAPSTTSASGAAPATTLTPKEIKKFNAMKNGGVHKVVQKTAGLTVAERTLPDPTQKTTKEKAVSGAKAVPGLLDEQGSDALNSAIAVASTVDAIGEVDKLGTWAKVGKAVSGDGKSQGALPIIGAVIEGGRFLIEAGKLIYKVVKWFKQPAEKRANDSFDWRSVLDTILQGGNAILAVMSSFTTFSGILPIIGAIFGAVTNAISFCFNFVGVVQNGKRLSRMKKQKEAAKGAIMEKQGPGGEFVTMRKRKGDPLGLFGVGMHFDKKDHGQTADKKVTKKQRSKRLDEVTSEMATQSGVKTPSEKDTLLRSLEDYDVTKELTGANEKRLADGATQIIFHDVLGFAAALAALDPQGIGGAVGTALTTAVALGEVAKTGIKAGRQVARNRGWLGADMNKSTYNKRARRHNLAVIMFDRIKELNGHNVSAVDPTVETPDKVKEIMTDYQTVDDRIYALSIGYGSLLNADTGDAMVEAMRAGFYRDAE